MYLSPANLEPENELGAEFPFESGESLDDFLAGLATCREDKTTNNHPGWTMNVMNDPAVAAVVAAPLMK